MGRWEGWEDFFTSQIRRAQLVFSRRISAGFRVCARLSARLKYPPIPSHPPTIEKVSFRFCFIFFDHLVKL
jgi:hypothetical protein